MATGDEAHQIIKNISPKIVIFIDLKILHVT